MRSKDRSMFGLAALVAMTFVSSAAFAQDGDKANDSAANTSETASEQKAPADGTAAAENKDGEKTGEAAAAENKDGEKTGEATATENKDGEKPGEAAAAPQKEQNCTDGVDNDGDQAVDCADADCVSDAACQAPPPSADKAPEPEAATPAPAPVPLQGQQAAQTPATSDSNADSGAKTDEKPIEKSLGIEGVFGLGSRIGGTSNGYAMDERAGLMLGGSVFFSPDRSCSFGLSYVHSQLGLEKESATQAQGTGINIRRHINTVMLRLRMAPYRTNKFRFWAGVGVGASIDSSHASGATISEQYPVTAEPYQVDVDSSVGFAVGGGLGFDYDLTRNLGMISSINFTEHFISSDPQTSSDPDVRVNGMGSTPQIDLRFGLQYRFDMSGDSASADVQVDTASR